MENILTKQNVLIVTLIGAALLVFSVYSEEVGLCKANDYSCSKYFDHIAHVFLIFLPSFFFSLVTYKMRAGVFGAWRNFAVVWLPISILLVAISPGTSADFQIIDKEFVAIVLSLLFTLISLILITYKSFAIRKKGWGRI